MVRSVGAQEQVRMIGLQVCKVCPAGHFAPRERVISEFREVGGGGDVPWVINGAGGHGGWVVDWVCRVVRVQGERTRERDENR
eukprot:767335-Hanusia_phi.AAC.9